jgi:hypothetical protein
MSRLARMACLGLTMAPLAAMACGGGNANNAAPPPTLPSASATASAPPSASTVATPPPPPSSAPATSASAPTATFGGTATPLDPTAAAGAVAVLNSVTALDAPGMLKEGTGVAGTFQQGQTIEQSIVIQPHKCYTFVAGGVGPTEIEISLVAKAPVPQLPGPQMGDAKGLGNKAALGPGANCIKLALIPFPVQAKWVITATKGAGIIAGQAYSKMVP